MANYGQTWSVLIRAKILLMKFLEKGANSKIIIIICFTEGLIITRNKQHFHTNSTTLDNE